MRTPAFSVEVITLPVGNVERALRFDVDQVGFTLDIDYSPNDVFRVVQLTPPGSSCSIQIGKGLTDAPLPKLPHGDVTITDASREFATAEVHRSHEIFNENPFTGCNSSISHSPTAV